MEYDAEHHGKTVRHVGYTEANLNPVITIDRKSARLDGKSTSWLVPVTEVDDLIGSIEMNEITLGKHNDWTTIIDSLEKIKTKKITQFNPRINCSIVSYYVPVTSYIKENVSVDDNIEKWPMHNGIHYDTNEIYCEKDTKLDVIGDVYLCKPVFKNNKINKLKMKVKYESTRKDTNSYLLDHDFQNYIFVQEGHDEYHCDQAAESGIIIDLGKSKNITHLGIIGAIPNLVYVESETKNTLKITKNHQCIPCTTAFSMYVKYDENTHDWSHIDSFTKPITPFEETVFNLDSYFNTKNGLFARFIKIVPTSWIINPLFRIALYGEGTKEDIEKKEESVIYHLTTYTNKNTFERYDGFGHCGCRMCKGKYRSARTSKKHDLHDQISEELDDMAYDEFND